MTTHKKSGKKVNWKQRFRQKTLNTAPMAIAFLVWLGMGWWVYIQVESNRAISKDAYAISQEQAFLTHNVLSTIDVPIVSVDSKLKIVGWTKGAEKKFGWSENDVIGKSLSFLMSAPVAHKHEEAVKNHTIVSWIRKGVAVDCQIKTKSGDDRRVVVFTYELNRPPAKYAAILHTPTEVLIHQTPPKKT